MSDDSQEVSNPPAEPDALRDAALPRTSRRLSDRVLVCFHQACDNNDHEVARRLLDLFEYIMTRRETPADLNRRRNMGSLVAAHERLWALRHPS